MLSAQRRASLQRRRLMNAAMTSSRVMTSWHHVMSDVIENEDRSVLARTASATTHRCRGPWQAQTAYASMFAEVGSDGMDEREVLCFPDVFVLLLW
jgi:hypothetical protein